MSFTKSCLRLQNGLLDLLPQTAGVKELLSLTRQLNVRINDLSRQLERHSKEDQESDKLVEKFARDRGEDIDYLTEKFDELIDLVLQKKCGRKLKLKHKNDKRTR